VAGEPDRLAPYHRLDASLQHERRIAGMNVEARLAVFNAYDRNNPRYRQVVGVRSQPASGEPAPFRFAGVAVYDLGIQPSFQLAVRW
jgi:hypothetical protein